jgi:hypothetical protein
LGIPIIHPQNKMLKLQCKSKESLETGKNCECQKQRQKPCSSDFSDSKGIIHYEYVPLIHLTMILSFGMFTTVHLSKNTTEFSGQIDFP